MNKYTQEELKRQVQQEQDYINGINKSSDTDEVKQQKIKKIKSVYKNDELKRYKKQQQILKNIQKIKDPKQRATILERTKRAQARQNNGGFVGDMRDFGASVSSSTYRGINDTQKFFTNVDNPELLKEAEALDYYTGNKNSNFSKSGRILGAGMVDTANIIAIDRTIGAVGAGIKYGTMATKFGANIVNKAKKIPSKLAQKGANYVSKQATNVKNYVSMQANAGKKYLGKKGSEASSWLYENSGAKYIGKQIQRGKSKINDGIHNGINYLSNTASEAKNRLLSYKNNVQQRLHNSYNNAQSYANKKYNAVANPIKKTYANAKDTVKNGYNSVTGFYNRGVNNVKNSLSQAYNTVATPFKNGYNRTIDGVNAVKEKITNGYDYVASPFRYGAKKVTEAKNSISRFAKSTYNKASDIYGSVKRTTLATALYNTSGALSKTSSLVGAASGVAGNLGLGVMGAMGALALGSKSKQTENAKPQTPLSSSIKTTKPARGVENKNNISNFTVSNYGNFDQTLSQALTVDERDYKDGKEKRSVKAFRDNIVDYVKGVMLEEKKQTNIMKDETRYDQDTDFEEAVEDKIKNTFFQGADKKSSKAPLSMFGALLGAAAGYILYKIVNWWLEVEKAGGFMSWFLNQEKVRKLIDSIDNIGTAISDGLEYAKAYILNEIAGILKTILPQKAIEQMGLTNVLNNYEKNFQNISRVRQIGYNTKNNSTVRNQASTYNKGAGGKHYSSFNKSAINTNVNTPLNKDRGYGFYDGWAISGVFGEQRSDHKHQGLDIAMPKGTPIASIADGIVIRINNNPNLPQGKSVTIQHADGSISQFFHLSKINVPLKGKDGKPYVVKRGDIIGASGNTSSVPNLPYHLHIQVQTGDRSRHFINPLTFIDEQNVINGGMFTQMANTNENSTVYKNPLSINDSSNNVNTNSTSNTTSNNVNTNSTSNTTSNNVNTNSTSTINKEVIGVSQNKTFNITKGHTQQYVTPAVMNKTVDNINNSIIDIFSGLATSISSDKTSESVSIASAVVTNPNQY